VGSLALKRSTTLQRSGLTERGGVEVVAKRASRRGNQEGSIYQRADGLWVGTVMLGRRADGKPDRPKVYGKTRSEVHKRLVALRRKAEEGLRADPRRERQKVADYLEDWLAASHTSVRPQTWDRFRQIVSAHLVPTLGQQKLSSLRPETIQRLYADKIKAGLAPNTVRKIHIVLHRALAMAVRWNYLPRNPAGAVDRPAVPSRDAPVLGPAEVNRLIATSGAVGKGAGATTLQGGAAWQWHMLWSVALHSGCREGELLGLKWSDLDFVRGTLTVRRTLISVHAQAPRFGEPKSKTSRRTIWLPAEAIALLRAHRTRQAETRLANPYWADHDLVFSTHIGTPLIRRNVLRAFKVALDRAGLPVSIRFHDLRHAHATLMLMAGVPLKVASGRLGHSGITITGDLYQHVASDMDRDAAERAAQALRVQG
jgi:integrase